MKVHRDNTDEAISNEILKKNLFHNLHQKIELQLYILDFVLMDTPQTKLAEQPKKRKLEDDNNNIVESENANPKAMRESQIKLEMLKKKNTDLHERNLEFELNMGYMKERFEGEIATKDKKIELFEDEVSTKATKILELEKELTFDPIELTALSAVKEEFESEIANKNAKIEAFEREFSAKDDQIKLLTDEIALNKSELNRKIKKIKEFESAKTEQALKTQNESDKLEYERTIQAKDWKLKESELKRKSVLAECAECVEVIEKASSTITDKMEKFKRFNLDCSGPTEAAIEEFKNMIVPNTVSSKPIEIDAPKPKIEKGSVVDAERYKNDALKFKKEAEEWKRQFNRIKSIEKIAHKHQSENSRLKNTNEKLETELVEAKNRLDTKTVNGQDSQEKLRQECAELKRKIESLLKARDNMTYDDMYSDMYSDDTVEVEELKKKIQRLEDGKKMQKAHYIEKLRVSNDRVNKYIQLYMANKDQFSASVSSRIDDMLENRVEQ